jgi:anti-sigma regulatory factor (Ser/Thr protein kinase)
VAPHFVVAVAETSQVGEARRHATRLAESIGLGESDAGRVALVATELATNLVHHAQGGRLMLAARAADAFGEPMPADVEMIAVDDGPGMGDVNACLRDGYSTAGTPGTGLGAVQRMADDVSISSTPGRGSIVLARVRARTAAKPAARPALRIGAISLPAPGESVCGDAYAIRVAGHGARVLVADGLGHGPGAAEASTVAVQVFDGAPRDAPAQLLERAHAPMRATRGAAAAMAQLDAAAGTLAFAGAGNICGRIVSGVGDRTLLSQHGTLGLQIRRLVDSPYEWPEHALLVMHSDGVATRWTLSETTGLIQCDPSVIAAWLLREHRRPRDDATVVVIRRH